MTQIFDKIIIGAGFYGLYAAYFSGKLGNKVLVLEREPEAFMHASYVNQARIHMGYHYPRSIYTAVKSKDYFERFVEDFHFCVNNSFEQIYAISANFSWTNAKQFEKFCKDAKIYHQPVSVSNYFKENLCEGAWLAKEYSFDAFKLRDWLLSEISKLSNVELHFSSAVISVSKGDTTYTLGTKLYKYESPFVLNATYASLNQIHKLAGLDMFNQKYEMCEVILCTVSENLKKVGLTVMDGPFFSLMPFGDTGFHSLTSVSFTPHQTSYDYSTFEETGNPSSAWPFMSQLAHKYLKSELKFEYVKSLYTIKTVLKTSEIDDGRPTVIRQLNNSPAFYSVLSGKINTVYDLEEILK